MHSGLLHPSRSAERGSALVLAAVSVVVLLAMAALAIDVVALYVARNEAQRAADAAALAGAAVFANSSCTTSGTCHDLLVSSALEPQVKAQAQAVGDENQVFGQNANINPATDITFPNPAGSDPDHDPLVQVTVHRDVPTFFAGALKRMLGGSASTIAVAATATAEAFNPSGSSLPFSTSCIKPWMLDNIDMDPAHAGPGGHPLFVSGGAVVNPGVYPTGIIGEAFTVTPTGGHQYQQLEFRTVNGTTYVSNIEGCNTRKIECGDSVYNLQGLMSGVTQSGVATLIHSLDPIVSTGGQDLIQVNAGNNAQPYTILAGSNNPLVGNGVSAGSAISTSSSIVTVPLYTDGTLCKGPDCPQQVVGFMQLFLEGAQANDTLFGKIINVAACNTSPSGSAIMGGGNTLIPVRLVQRN